MLVSGIFLYVAADVLMPAYFFSFDTAVWLSGSSDVVMTKFSNLSVVIECGTGKAFGVSAFLESVRRHWCGPKVGTQKENTV